MQKCDKTLRPSFMRLRSRPLALTQRSRLRPQNSTETVLRPYIVPGF